MNKVYYLMAYFIHYKKIGKSPIFVLFFHEKCPIFSQNPIILFFLRVLLLDGLD